MDKITIKTIEDLTDSLDILEEYVEEGIITQSDYKLVNNIVLDYINSHTIMVSNKSDMIILAEAIENLSDRLDFSLTTLIEYLEILIEVNYFAYLEVMLKEVANIMNAEYLNSKKNLNHFYCISKKDMHPTRVSKDTHTIEYLATFRSAEDANRALEICTLWGKIGK